MADIFCDDGGSNDTPHETWAKAATTFLVAVDAAAAGDRIIIGADHAENDTANKTYAFPGTAASPNIVISSTVGAGSAIVYNRADNIQIDMSASARTITFTGHVQMEGLSFKAGSNIIMTQSLGQIDCFECTFDIGGSADFQVGSSNGSWVRFKDVDVTWSNSGNNSSNFVPLGINFTWDGGILSWTGTQPTALFNGGSKHNQIHIAGVDLSAITTALLDVTDNWNTQIEMHHCLLNSGVAATTGTHNNLETTFLMSGCDDTTGNDLYRLEYVDFWGSTVHDDAIFRTTDGASDGTTPISWKMVSTANAAEFVEPTRSPPIYSWVDATGSTTFTVQCLWDSVTDIQDDEIWLEIEFLEASADTDSAFADDRMTDISSTPGDQTTNATAWTETLTNDNEFALAVTVTVNRVGPVIGRVYLAKPSTTIYVDPLVVKS